jgi:small subunit ribosomal protein S20
VANVESAKKRVRQTEKRTLRNRHQKATVRGFVKKVREAITAGNKADAKKALVVAQKRIDQAVQKGVFPTSTGSRYISRLSAQVSALA